MANPVPGALDRQAMLEFDQREFEQVGPENAQRRDVRDRTSRCWGIVFMGVGLVLTTASMGLPFLWPASNIQSTKEIVGACFLGGLALGIATTVSGFSKFMFGHYCCSCRSTPHLANGDVGMTA